MVRSCALMAVYNEEDIILESVTKLIDQGVDVFIIDNASTDSTIKNIQHLVGKGVVDICHVKYTEDNKEVYKWESLLKDKEDWSRKLGYDWYLHVDADEIRYAPWSGLSLSEGIAKVDREGYNLINFKLFNFRLYQGLKIDAHDYESSMSYYSFTETFNQSQVKAWKFHNDIDLSSFGGHIASVPNGKIYPVRFIHKHYPIRSEAHAVRKIITERKSRFSQEEKNKGWHLQYDHIDEGLIKPEDYLYSIDVLRRYDHDVEMIELLTESSTLLSEGCVFGSINPDFLADSDFVSFWKQKMLREGVPEVHADKLFDVAMQLPQIMKKLDKVPLSASEQDGFWISLILRSYARKLFLSGRPSLLLSIDKLFIVNE